MTVQQLNNKSNPKKDFPKSDLDKQAYLMQIMEKFVLGKIYLEHEVCEVIKKYFDDTNLIRRELINFGYMRRDPYKGRYWVKKHKLNEEELHKIRKTGTKLQKFK